MSDASGYPAWWQGHKAFWPVVAIDAAALAAITSWGFVRLRGDARVPVHFNIRGEADGFADKPVGLLLLPVLCAVVALVFFLLPKIEPRARHLAESSQAYAGVFVWTLVPLTLLQAFLVHAAVDESARPQTWVPLILGLMLIGMGNRLPKVRSNFFVGMRTPWTLSSEVAWERTNRWAGRMFVLGGAGSIAAGLAGSAVATAVVMAATSAAVLALIPYSYAVWRRERRQSATPPA